MPPKKGKKGGGKKGGGKKKGGKKGKKGEEELTPEEQLKKSTMEMQNLKHHLSLQNSLSRRTQSARDQLKTDFLNLTDQLEEERSDQLDVHNDLARQFKTFQTEKNLVIDNLQRENIQLNNELTNCQQVLANTIQEKDSIIRKKEDEVTELRNKLRILESTYQNIFDTSLRNLQVNLTKAKDQWERSSIDLQDRTKERLKEFGINFQEF
ncbi:coiled-coil domain-containing protein 153-like [Symsagittifera roscoffensis]|uniref:coiled-coil domain-containing protein 153-like n=1 Tax=Symsagittifera roscoffensis TaxID=84072 RepID=UPI00307CABE2